VKAGRCQAEVCLALARRRVGFASTHSTTLFSVFPWCSLVALAYATLNKARGGAYGVSPSRLGRAAGTVCMHCMVGTTSWSHHAKEWKRWLNWRLSLHRVLLRQVLTPPHTAHHTRVMSVTV
jgi:hypothetical protein